MRCEGLIWRELNYVQCACASKVTRNGRDYCGIHDPEAKAAREAKTQARWAAERIATDARYAANTAARKRAELCVSACSTLTDKGVSELGRLLSRTPGFRNELNRT